MGRRSFSSGSGAQDEPPNRAVIWGSVPHAHADLGRASAALLSGELSMTTTTITPDAPHGLPIVADRMPERTIDALLDGAVPLGTTRGVGYLRVGVVLARDEASGKILGLYATEGQWSETTAAALIERETDNDRLRAALAEQENQNAQQAEELRQLRAQLAAPTPPATPAAQPADIPAAVRVRAPIPCPDPTCTETRETGQALGRHCQSVHGATLSDLRARYAAPAQAAPDAAQPSAPEPDPASIEEPEKCPECDVMLPPRSLAHHAIDAHGELLTVLRRRQAVAASAAPPDGDT